MKVHEDSDDEENLLDWLSGDDSQNDRRRQTAASYLNDEIEDDVPVGIERREIHQQVYNARQPQVCGFW